jgi:hypothetical protein
VHGVYGGIDSYLKSDRNYAVDSLLWPTNGGSAPFYRNKNQFLEKAPVLKFPKMIEKVQLNAHHSCKNIRKTHLDLISKTAFFIFNKILYSLYSDVRKIQ